MNPLPVPRRLTDFSTDALALAPRLLGKFLCRRLANGTVLRRRITETEAYFGEEDTACHAHKGRTPRTDVLYAAGGCAYASARDRLRKWRFVSKDANEVP